MEEIHISTGGVEIYLQIEFSDGLCRECQNDRLKAVPVKGRIHLKQGPWWELTCSTAEDKNGLATRRLRGGQSGTW